MVPHAQDVRLVHDVNHDTILGVRVHYDVRQQLLVAAKVHNLTQHRILEQGHNMLQIIIEVQDVCLFPILPNLKGGKL